MPSTSQVRGIFPDVHDIFVGLGAGVRDKCSDFMTIFFANKTIGIHLIKGVLGITALILSVWTLPESIWPSVVLLPVAIYLLKGCPMCWVIGLFGTIVDVIQRRKMLLRHRRDCESVKN